MNSLEYRASKPQLSDLEPAVRNIYMRLVDLRQSWVRQLEKKIENRGLASLNRPSFVIIGELANKAFLDDMDFQIESILSTGKTPDNLKALELKWQNAFNEVLASFEQ